MVVNLKMLEKTCQYYSYVVINNTILIFKFEKMFAFLFTVLEEFRH